MNIQTNRSIFDIGVASRLSETGDNKLRNTQTPSRTSNIGSVGNWRAPTPMLISTENGTAATMTINAAFWF